MMQHLFRNEPIRIEYLSWTEAVDSLVKSWFRSKRIVFCDPSKINIYLKEIMDAVLETKKHLDEVRLDSDYLNSDPYIIWEGDNPGLPSTPDLPSKRNLLESLRRVCRSGLRI